MKNCFLYCFSAFTAITIGSSTKTLSGVQDIDEYDFLGEFVPAADVTRIERNRDTVKEWEGRGEKDFLYARWMLQHSYLRARHEEIEGPPEKLYVRGGKQWTPGPPKVEPAAPYDPNWKPPKMNINPDQKIVRNTLRCSARTHKCKGTVLYENGSQA